MRVLLLTVSLERWLNRLILAKVVFWKIGKGLGVLWFLLVEINGEVTNIFPSNRTTT